MLIRVTGDTQPLRRMVIAMLLVAGGLTNAAQAETMPLPGLKSGATVRLGPGPYPALTFKNQHFDPPVTIEAGKAVVMGVTIRNSSGIVWRGGEIRAPQGRDGNNPDHWGMNIRSSDGVTLENARVTDAYHGVMVGDSRNIVLRNNDLTGLRSDGMDVVGTSNVLIENNRFTDIRPHKATGSKAAGDWKDGDHPDAVQIWSTKDNPRVTDITIRGNTVEGDTQGFNFFGPKHDGNARIRIENNAIHITYPPAISIFRCDDCSIRGNRVWRIAGAPHQANIRFETSTGQACGNIMPDWRDHPAMKRCK